MIIKEKMNVNEMKANNKNVNKMDVDSNLHIQINSIQAKLFEKFRVKVKIKDITDECIIQGLHLAEESITKRLNDELIINPVYSK